MSRHYSMEQRIQVRKMLQNTDSKNKEQLSKIHHFLTAPEEITAETTEPKVEMSYIDPGLQTGKYWKNFQWRVVAFVFLFSGLILLHLKELQNPEYDFFGITSMEVQAAITKEFDFNAHIPYTFRDEWKSVFYQLTQKELNYESEYNTEAGTDG
ncbi:MAG: hypothetical protein PHP50_01480 [Lachnospiraceae bacterium]|nr:hypothetical protein [Lachnospiraceae bacterium]